MVIFVKFPKEHARVPVTSAKMVRVLTMCIFDEDSIASVMIVLLASIVNKRSGRPFSINSMQVLNFTL